MTTYNPTPHLYHYKASVVSIYDGDTVTVDVDLGLGVWLRGQKVRLHGINAPEVRGETREAGIAARNFLIGLLLYLPSGTSRDVFLRTYKDSEEKYGRWLARIYFAEGSEFVDVNAKMVEAGHAVEYLGR